jgi:acetyl-CoA C-acetyltransferase
MNWYWGKKRMMQHVFIIGAGATPVGEHYTRTLTELSLDALRAALADVQPQPDPSRISALYVANAMGETLAAQAHLGTSLAASAGLYGIEALRIEAAGASGGAALHQAAMAVASGTHDLVAVLGVEKVTDKLQAAQDASMSLALNSEFEAEHGITLTAQWALLMRRYMHEYGYEADAFAPFPINAHANGVNNPDALYRFPVKASTYQKAGQIASPLNMLDCSTLADGAAAVLVASEGLARELGGPRVRIAGRSLATDRLALCERDDMLWLQAAHQSATSALRQANVTPTQVDVLDITDPHGIAAALVLESCGFVDRGTAPRHAADGGIAPDGSTPLATGGGYKSRGDAGGANGVYQVVELVRQLRGQAPSAQVDGARVGFAQCLGGVGATAVTHVLIHEREA